MVGFRRFDQPPNRFSNLDQQPRPGLGIVPGVVAALRFELHLEQLCQPFYAELG
jgi:hypothetical protein